MRVALLHPARTEEDGTQVEPSISAFRMGRIEGFTNPITAEHTSAEDVALHLIAAAEQEHPECEVFIQHLVDNGDGTSRWVKAHEVPEGAVSPDGKPVAVKTLSIEQSQTAGGEAS